MIELELKKIFDWLEHIFRIERCENCQKILSHSDKQKGGCGFANGKSFSYCINCSQGFLNDIFAGNTPNFLKS